MKDEDLELKNSDPDDVSDMIPMLEKSFGIKFEKNAFTDVGNFGELCDVVDEYVASTHRDDCTTQQAFYRVRRAIAYTLDIGPATIRPDMSLEELFPSHFRRKTVREFISRLNVPVKLLTYPDWIAVTLSCLFIVTFIWSFFNPVLGLTGFALCIVTFKLADRLSNRLRFKKVSELVIYLRSSFYQSIRRNPETINPREVADVVADLFSQQLAIPKRHLHRAATFSAIAGSFLLLSSFKAQAQELTSTEPTQFSTTQSLLTIDTLHKVSDQFIFTEGPAVDHYGNIYFTDQPRDQIWKYDTRGQLLLFMNGASRSNGLYFAGKGKLLSCADDHNELISIDKFEEKTVLVKYYEGKAFNGPNDLWVDPDGGIWFTDPYYQRDYWTRKKPELSFQGLFYLAKGAKAAILLDSTMTRPNGIVGTADGKTLYVSDIGAGKTYRYSIAKHGIITGRSLFVEQGSDGMTLDRRGNLYLCGKGVTAYDPTGAKVLYIPVPSKWVGNICFGGKKRNLLFITASESIYTIRMMVKGVE